ncbi:MAG: cytochrome c3 family protein [Deltaproteobacteria bacterium]|nr:MAG: cytochrome c3 family protein [Deltaproteobacteria bacterium]
MKNLSFKTILLILVSVIITIASQAEEAQEVKSNQNYIAVLDLHEKEDVPQDIAVQLTDSLQQEMLKTQQYTVFDRAYRDKKLTEQGLQIKDCLSIECFIKAGQLLDVGKVVTGSIDRFGRSCYINVQLINVNTALVEASADAICEECSSSELICPVKNIAKKLLGIPYEETENNIVVGSPKRKDRSLNLIIEAKNGDVILTHWKHVSEYKIKCIICHHKTKEGKTPQKCLSCHSQEEKKGKIIKLRDAFHEQCRGCHLKVNKEEGKEAPGRKCRECHIKKRGK